MCRALQFLTSEVTSSQEIEGELINDAQIANMLRNLTLSPLGIDDEDDFRISIAGAQEKSDLLCHDGVWKRSVGMTPTTHILKTQLGILPSGINLSGSVENEFFCMNFCRAMGLNVADVEIVDFEDVCSLVVTRFDRRWMNDGRLIRLPQEDFCQALGVPPSQKYQMDGGPSIADSIALLSASNDPAEDQRAFMKAQVLFWLLGATDGHAKNFSIALLPRGLKMTPFYDVLSVQSAVDSGAVLHNRMRLAMAVDGHYRINEIVPRHYLQASKNGGYGVRLIENIIDEVPRSVDSAIKEAVENLSIGFPQELAETISTGINSRLKILKIG